MVVPRYDWQHRSTAMAAEALKVGVDYVGRCLRLQASAANKWSVHIRELHQSYDALRSYRTTIENMRAIGSLCSE